MAMYANGQMIVEEFEVHGLLKDGEELWFDSYDDMVLDQERHGGRRLVRTCYMTPAREVDMVPVDA